MEVVKKNGEVTQYRYYEWNDYTPIGLIVKEKEASGNYQTKTYQYITNQRGDVLSIRDQEDQEVGSYRYDAYGNVLSVEGDVAKDNPIRYTGYYYDEETKNYYLQARYYNPENGAFLELDSDSGDNDDPQSQQGYNYVSSNPLKYTDHSGESKFTILIKWGKTAGKWVVKKGKKVWKAGKKVVRKIKTTFVIPKEAKSTLKYIKKHGHPKKGYKGGSTYVNKTGLLPKNTTYKEYDIFPKRKGVNRGIERIVIGKNGKAYYTNNHYKSFRIMN